LLGNVWEATPPAEVLLGDDGGLTIPRSGAAEVVVRSPGGSPVSVPLEPMGQWDAEAVIDAIANHAGERLRDEAILRLLSADSGEVGEPLEVAVRVG
jgi:hypothetical protein